MDDLLSIVPMGLLMGALVGVYMNGQVAEPATSVYYVFIVAPVGKPKVGPVSMLVCVSMLRSAQGRVVNVDYAAPAAYRDVYVQVSVL